MKQLKVLIACETSATVRNAFAKLGWHAVSCDVLPCEQPDFTDAATGGVGLHYQGDVKDLLNTDKEYFDLLIAHPPCTYLSVSGMHWTKRGLRDPQLTEDAVEFAKMLFNCNIKHKCIENPVSILSTRIRKPDQIIQPYEFGHDASKKTCLWLENLPLLPKESQNYIEPRIVDGKKRWANQTDSGQNKLTPSKERWKERSRTYQGVADAMAKYWTDYLTNRGVFLHSLPSGV